MKPQKSQIFTQSFNRFACQLEAVNEFVNDQFIIINTSFFINATNVVEMFVIKTARELIDIQFS